MTATYVSPWLVKRIEDQMKRTEIIKDMELKQVVGEMPDKITVTKPESVPPKILTALPEGIPPNTITGPIGNTFTTYKPPSEPYQVYDNTPDMKYVRGPTAILTPEQEEDLRSKIEEFNKGQRDLQAGKATRFNANKRKWALLPLEVLEPIIEVLEFGAKKYAAWNFAEGPGLSWTEVGESLQRHLNAWMRGEDLDPESGMSHLGHIGCNLVFLLYYMKYKDKYGVSDDRNKR